MELAEKALLPIMPLAIKDPNTPVEQVHTGVMVALMIPPGIAEAIAIPGGEPVGELHLTLAYLGDSTDPLMQENMGLVQAALDEFYRTAKPLSGEISGIGLFNSGGDPLNQTSAFYASFDSPDLTSFRATLLNCLSMHGIDPVSNHGFTPHITLAYVPVGSPLPPVQVPQLPVTFEAVTLAWGGQRFDFILEEESLKPREADSLTNNFDTGLDATSKERLAAVFKANYAARAGGVIAGRLARANDGKFTSAGSAPAASSTSSKPQAPEKAAAQAQQRQERQERQDLADRQRQERQDSRDQAKTDAQQKAVENVGNLAEKLLDPDMAEVLTVGDPIGNIDGVEPEYGDKLVARGLATRYQDGSYDLTPTGSSMVNAMKKGNERKAKQAIMRAQALADRKAAAAAKRAKRKHKEVTVATPLETSFKVYTGHDGSPRWVLFSSSGFRDRDGEFVTTKALGECVDRSYKNHLDRNFGPLRWWHVPGWDIGQCDYRAMSGSILVESGTFKSRAIGDAVARYNEKKPLGASLGFFNTGTDHEGAFNYIETFERSLLPSLKASNWLTRLFISKKQKEEPKMLSQKAKELIELLGSDEQAISDVTDIIRQAKETQTAATAAGHSLKAAGPGAPPADMMDDSEDLGDGGADDDLEGDDGDLEATVAEMTPMELHEQLQTVIDATVQKALGPLMDLLKTATSATAATTKEAQDSFNARLDQVAQTQKEANSKAEQRLARLEGTVKELAGETPRAFKGYRASQEPTTVSQKEEALKAAQPQADPFAVTFFTELGIPGVAGVQAQQPQS